MPGPFDPNDDRAYAVWRDRKLARAASRVEDLIVEVDDPGALRPSERDALLERCAASNMAIYASRAGTPADRALARQVGAQLGLAQLDAHYLSDGDGISAITPGTGVHGEFIPYTDRALGWHTDGAYNPPGRDIRAMTLHCVCPAAQGGESALLDHEIAYLRLRDADRSLVRALFARDAMTIPARMAGEAVAREVQTGPVFRAFDGGSTLHMRYTARSTHVTWKADPALAAALRLLAGLLADDAPYVLRLRLAAGMGIVCNNVLHRRSAFRDAGGPPRLLYRGRYLDRIVCRDRAGIGG